MRYSYAATVEPAYFPLFCKVAEETYVVKVDSVEIYKPETTTPADWQNAANAIDWQVAIRNNQDLKFKVGFSPELPSKANFPSEIKVASFVNTAPSWVTIPVDASDILSPDGKELWVTVTNSELKSLGVLPDLEHDPPYEQMSFDSILSINYNDSDRFDAVKADIPRVNARGPGNWTATPVTWHGNTVPAWSAYAANGSDYLKAGGATYVEVQVAGASDRALLQDQADWLYISGHGDHSAGTVCGVGPADVDWRKDLDTVVIAGCAVLDVDDLNGNYDDDQSPGTEVGPASVVFPGELWAMTGPSVLMGYNFFAPADNHAGDPQFTAKIIEKQLNYRRSYADCEAWKRANQDMAGGWSDSPYNASCILANIRIYYYFDKGLYVPVWTSYGF